MRIELRPLQPSDREALTALCSAVDRTYLSGRLPEPYTEADAERWLAETARKEGAEGLFRLILADGVPVGQVTVERKDDIGCRDAEIGYTLATAYWSRGIMTQAVGILCREAFTAWDILRISGRAHAENIASRRVMEKNGFVLEGTLHNAFFKDGRVGDICLYGLLREDYVKQNTVN